MIDIGKMVSEYDADETAWPTMIQRDDHEHWTTEHRTCNGGIIAIVLGIPWPYKTMWDSMAILGVYNWPSSRATDQPIPAAELEQSKWALNLRNYAYKIPEDTLITCHFV